MANIHYVGASYTNPLRVLPSGVMKLESTTDYSLAYRVMTASPTGTADGTNAGQLKLEWRPEGDVIGARFGVFLASSAGASKVYLGEISYNRRQVSTATFSSATTLTSAKARNRCQVDNLAVPVASNLIFDGASTVRLYLVPRDEQGAIVTAAEYSFPE